MALDLTRLHTAAAAHTAAVQALLNSNATHVASAKAATADEATAQEAITKLAAEFESQTATLTAFNAANTAAAA
jgi:hypothetical protein